MAEQTLPVISSAGAAGTPAAASGPRAFKLPARELAVTSATSKLAGALGFVGIAAVALLTLLVLARQRELILLREQVAHALALEAHQRPLLATVPGSIAAPEPAQTIYQARKRWRRGILATGAVAIVGICVALAVHFLPVIFG